MTIDLAQRVRAADEALRALSDHERRRVTQGYFPTSMEILGVSATGMRNVLRDIVRDLREEGAETVLAMVRELRSTGTHEGRQIAFELLDRRKDTRALLGPGEIAELGEGNDNWASVDAFSCYVSGPAWREAQIADEEVLTWARSPDLWWRRTALVSTVPLNMKSRGGTGDPGRTIMICSLLVDDAEPMVAKALSWALRALISRDRERVEDFLQEHGDSLPALVRREVRNKLRTGRKNPRGRRRSADGEEKQLGR